MGENGEIAKTGVCFRKSWEVLIYSSCKEKSHKVVIPAQAGIHDCASHCNGFPPARE